MRLTYYIKNENAEPELMTVSGAKKMIRRNGGTAFTQHIDRDGTIFEVTPIQLAGNNSHFKYNAHL